jgi:hypothetical protein
MYIIITCLPAGLEATKTVSGVEWTRTGGEYTLVSGQTGGHAGKMFRSQQDLCQSSSLTLPWVSLDDAGLAV